jgi:CheY-like chemotaxis protein
MTNVSDWNVLIVDDEPDNRGVVELVFQFYNAKVRAASSGEECLRLLEQERPMLLLIDIQMPDMDGYELFKKVRENPAWNDVRVVAVTAYAKHEDQERIMAAGFDGYIGKPVSVVSLIDELEPVMKREGR